MNGIENADGSLEQQANGPERYHLKLFIAGASVTSLRSIENMKEFCNNYLPEGYDLEIIDIYQQPLLAEQEHIIALPLLIKKHPQPERRFIGDMSDSTVLLKGLGIPAKN
jgi:circadian clock protein KaiB